jgi:hypothetical protein
MLTPVSLIKANPLLPAEDYQALRSQGIKLIEQLGSDIWTNYNYSDPGITILEAVCYAITDLSYRTDFDIKDLLAPEQLTNNTWKEIFYTAKHILHNSALTINDYRKLIIDIEGVRNAWLTMSKDYEVPIWIDYNSFEKRVDYDCDCEEKEEKVCYGKLGLSQVTVIAAKTAREAKLTQLEAIMVKLQANLDEKTAALNALPPPPDTDYIALEKLTAEIARLTDEKNILLEEITDAKDTTFVRPEILEMEGLYNVMVEYEEDVIDAGKREEVRQLVIDKLAANRNLCEDFLSIDAVEYEDFGIGASIVLEENADPDLVLAQMFFTIYKYFTPSVPFHTIQQMLDKNYEVDEIFEGPALEHGFIDSADLEKTDLFRNIMLSELISDIANIPGIKGITYLHLPFTGAADTDTSGNLYFDAWIDNLQSERKVARIQPAKSQVLFCKERQFITYNTGSNNDRKPDKMLRLFTNMKAAERRYKLIGAELDFAVPNGEYMNLEDYYPVTYSLPVTYGVSERGGLPANADAGRTAQALQLGGYLLFFEQVLKDYLVQLNHLRELFRFDDEPRHTYFTTALTEIENLNQLLIDKNNHGPNNFDLIVKDFEKVIKGLTESHDLFRNRRNEFLDHMLARFSEGLTDYEALMKWMDPKHADAKLIGDKTRILKKGEYQRISSDRAQAYNYALPNTWDSGNVSGAERRIGRLLGFENVKRRSLVPSFLMSEPLMVQDDSSSPPKQKLTKTGVPLNVIKIVDPLENETVIFTSVEVMQGCCTELLMEDILEHADDRAYFKFSDEVKTRSRRSAGLVGKFWFELYDSTDPATAVLLGTSETFSKKSDRDEAFTKLEKLMKHINANEGMHMIEHILLRPKLDEVVDETGSDQAVSLLDICLNSCDLNATEDEQITEPPYIKKITRVPAAKCYDSMPWVLQYVRSVPEDNVTQPGEDLPAKSLLYQKVYLDGTNPMLLKFRKYEDMVQRIKDLYEFGSERINYQIVADNENPAKYGFIINGANGVVLAQSLYLFNKSTDTPDTFDIEKEIAVLMEYFGYRLYLYCNSYPCDASTDPYSFHTTVVLPCWPKRLRDPSFRNLVEKTIIAESPAHIITRVMWIGIEEMQRFEKAYSDWLIEMAQTEVPEYDVVNPLVDVLNSLVPCGVCADECTHENGGTPHNLNDVK